MTESQRKLAEDNHNLIYSFLNIRNLDVEEYYDIMAIALCKAAKTFDGEKAKFSTYAFYLMKNALYIDYREKSKLSAIPEYMIDHYEAYIEDDDNKRKETTYLELMDSGIDTESDAMASMLLDKCDEILSERDNQIIRLRLCGYTQQEIADKMGVTRSRINGILKSIKDKLAKEYHE